MHSAKSIDGPTHIHIDFSEFSANGKPTTLSAGHAVESKQRVNIKLRMVKTLKTIIHNTVLWSFPSS